jgi:hypothetical protein
LAQLRRRGSQRLADSDVFRGSLGRDPVDRVAR